MSPPRVGPAVVTRAGVRESSGRVHATDAGVGVRAPEECNVEHAGQHDVRHVAPAPGEQPRVFLAEMPVADELHADAAAARPAAAASSAACTMC